MSKNISRFLAVTAALVVLTNGAFVYSRGTPGQTQQRPAISSLAAREAAIVATTAAVLEETSKIRELSILRPVKSGAQSRAEIQRMLVKNLYEQMTMAEMHATEVAYRKFGLAPANFEYRPFIIKLLLEQVAGYYDPVAREFYLADWLELESQRPVMAHELTHALQDQHFNLRRFQKWPHGDSDAQLAAHALIEGDATFAMMVYMAKNPLVALAFTRSLSSGVSTEQFNQAPRALRETLIFPYLQGSEWASRLHQREGFAGLSKAFTKLPLSTEQILHAEKYFAYEQPLKITLPDLSGVLNAANRAGSSAPRTARRRLATASGHRIDSDVNGEWGYYLLLDQFLNSPAESRRAAAGWAGDRYDIYEGANPGQVMLAHVSVWDTENDAHEFFDAYVKRTQGRYANAKQLETTSDPQTQNSKLKTRNFYSWQTSEGRLVMELRGLRVAVIEGIPQQNDENDLLRALKF
jgi:Zn-dependent peptidase ImmA (M78 family)